MVAQAQWWQLDFLWTHLTLALLYAACVLALAAAVIEELLFRGLLLGLLLRWRTAPRYWPVVAICVQAGLFAAVQAGLFAAVHALADSPTPLLDALPVWLSAVILGATMQATGRLWLAIGVHAGWNVVQYIAFGVQKNNLNYLAGLFATAPIAQVAVAANWLLIGVALLWFLRWHTWGKAWCLGR